jgi:hypothetical protein
MNFRKLHVSVYLNTSVYDTIYTQKVFHEGHKKFSNKELNEFSM